MEKSSKSFILFSILAIAIAETKPSRKRPSNLDKVLEKDHRSVSDLRIEWKANPDNFRYSPVELESFFNEMEKNYGVKKSLRAMKSVPQGTILNEFQEFLIRPEKQTLRLNQMIQSKY